MKNKQIIGLLIGTIILTYIAGLSNTQKEQKLIIENLKYDKESLEITGNIRTNSNGNVSLNFYDTHGYIGDTIVNLSSLSSFTRIFSLKISRNPIGILKVDSKFE